MKYVLMFTSRPDLRESIDPERAQEVYNEIYKWFGEHAEGGRIADGGAELHDVDTATTVKSTESGEVVVVDGPFSEAREVVGGFTVIEVPDMDAAIAMTKSWPALAFPGTAIEIRPMVVDYSQFEE
ncbi:MAG TPA: YciI family protein [Nocardioidaceae bacterium]|nr:YciI family protein [Nocardioidaceae bacterium]